MKHRYATWQMNPQRPRGRNFTYKFIETVNEMNVFVDNDPEKKEEKSLSVFIRLSKSITVRFNFQMRLAYEGHGY